MRPVVSRQDELLQWIEENPGSVEVRSVARAVRGRIILCGPLSRKELLQHVSLLENEQSQELLIQIIGDFVFINSENPKDLEDPALRHLTGISFVHFAVSDELDASFSSHSGIMRVGESREGGFERLFGHLLPGAKTIEIVDKFFAEKAAANEEVVRWLIQQIAKHTSCPIRIRSAIPQGDSKAQHSYGYGAMLKKLSDSLASNKSELSFDNEVHLDLYEKVPHNRYLRVQFSGGAIYCSIDHGIDAFKDDPVSEPEPVKDIGQAAFTDILRSSRWVPSPQEELAPFQAAEGGFESSFHIRIPKRIARGLAATKS
jgi:hypothetical protein